MLASLLNNTLLQTPKGQSARTECVFDLRVNLIGSHHFFSVKSKFLVDMYGNIEWVIGASTSEPHTCRKVADLGYGGGGPGWPASIT